MPIWWLRIRVMTWSTMNMCSLRKTSCCCCFEYFAKGRREWSGCRHGFYSWLSVFLLCERLPIFIIIHHLYLLMEPSFNCVYWPFVFVCLFLKNFLLQSNIIIETIRSVRGYLLCFSLHLIVFYLTWTANWDLKAFAFFLSQVFIQFIQFKFYDMQIKILFFFIFVIS